MWEHLAGGPVKPGTMRGSTDRHFFFCSVKKLHVVVDIADAVDVGEIHDVVLDAGCGPTPPHPIPQ